MNRQPEAEDSCTCRAGGERVPVRGEYLPLVELYRVFEVEGAKTDATQGIVVIPQRRPLPCVAGGSAGLASIRWW